MSSVLNNQTHHNKQELTNFEKHFWRKNQTRTFKKEAELKEGYHTQKKQDLKTKWCICSSKIWINLQKKKVIKL